MDVIVAIEGTEKIEKALQAAASQGRIMLPIMKKIGKEMIGIVDRNFEAEGRPKKWKSRSAITNMIYGLNAMNGARATKRYQKAKNVGTRAGILRRASLKAFGNRILSLSGELKNSMDCVATESMVIVGPAGARKYARIHQLGGMAGRNKKVKIIARPYLIVPPEEIPGLARIAAEAFSQGVRRS